MQNEFSAVFHICTVAVFYSRRSLLTLPQEDCKLLHKALIFGVLLLFVTNGKALELLKIPALVEHFSQHKSQQQELSFAEFLFMHYVGDDDNDADNTEDGQLPFKNSEEMNGFNGDWYVASPLIVKWETVNLPIQKQVIPFSKENYQSSCTDQLLRPPMLG